VDKCKAAGGAPKRNSFPPPPSDGGQDDHAAAAPQPRAGGVSGGGGAAGAAGRPAKTPGYNVAYVGNVAFEVTREELAEVFGACGVKLVRLHTDQNTGRSKGYAHVHFEDEAGLDRWVGGGGEPGEGGLATRVWPDEGWSDQRPPRVSMLCLLNSCCNPTTPPTNCSGRWSWTVT
jgi:hypothetical protein